MTRIDVNLQFNLKSYQSKNQTSEGHLRDSLSICARPFKQKIISAADLTHLTLCQYAMLHSAVDKVKNKTLTHALETGLESSLLTKFGGHPLNIFLMRYRNYGCCWDNGLKCSFTQNMCGNLRGLHIFSLL